MAVKQGPAGCSRGGCADEGKLAVSMFGGLSVTIDAAPVTGLTHRKADHLLAYLVLEGGRRVHCSTLAATFWPATESMDSLHHGFGALRHALGNHGPRVKIAGGVAAFDLNGAHSDVTAFDAAIAASTPDSLKVAVALYSGPLLRGWQERWVTAHRERRRKQYIDAVRTLAATARAAEDFASAADWSRRLTAAAPGDEQAWALLMETLVLAGERTAAIDAFELCRTQLGSRYGISPPEAMVQMERSIRVGSPSGAGVRSGAPPATAAQAASAGGAVPAGAAVYIHRPQDDRLAEAMRRHESIILIRGPRHSGKSSLLARGMADARAHCSRAVHLDIATLTEAEVAGMEELCAALAGRLSMALDLDEDPRELWRSHLGPGANLERYVTRRVLSADDAPLALALDGADRLLGMPYSDEFFSLLRVWHEKRAFEPDRPWDRLTVVLVCATEPHLYISDLNRSPFNVGARVEMTDFTAAEVAELAERIGLAGLDEAEMQECWTALGGHPYLTARAFSDMAAHHLGWPEYTRMVRSDFGPFSDLLQSLRQSIEADPELTEAVACLKRDGACSERGFFRLRSAGVLAGETRSNARWRCGLYAERLSPIGTG
ncbi:MAG: AAA-like domain-containing protein [Armatimonadetes bacterium]|nr:AAA-like domain-containing protein [Armatimonadota bacterium]